MGSFVDAMLSMLFGWLQALVNWIWGVIDRGGSALGTWFLQNWLPLTLILIAGGLVVDWFIWLIRWRPYHVWGTRLRHIGRFFRRSSSQEDIDTPAYAEAPAPGEEASPEAYDETAYLQSYQTEIYAPTGIQAPADVNLEDTYVNAPMASEDIENPDFYPEDPPPEAEDAYDDIPWTDWDAIAAEEEAGGEPPDWASVEELEEPPEGEEPSVSPAYSAQEAESFAYRELIPLDEEDPEAEPPLQDQEPSPDEAAEMEAEEMFDDFSHRGAPEPPRERRRWEFPEDDAPATTRRRRTQEEEEPPPTHRNSRPPEASSRRRREAEEAYAEPIGGVDPLAAYDAPEVMEQMQQGRVADNASYVEDGSPRRRRRSRRYREEASQQQPEDDFYEDYPEEPAREESGSPEPDAAGSAPRRGRSGRRGRSQTRAQTEDFAEDNRGGDFAEEEPYYEEPFYEENLPRNAYDDDAYFHDDPYAEDLPDPTPWPNWEEEPELPRDQRNRGVTKPSLIDRLRGMSSSTHAPMPEEDDYYDGSYDDEIDGMEEPRPKKKGFFSRLLNPEQSEFEQPRPKPRVRQEDAYNEPVYPPKKRR